MISLPEGNVNNYLFNFKKLDFTQQGIMSLDTYKNFLTVENLITSEPDKSQTILRKCTKNFILLMIFLLVLHKNSIF